MKHFIIAFAFIGILTSCNSSDKPKTNTTETIVESKKIKQFKAIDTDEALIATALMAAPEESRDNCTIIGYNIKGEFVTFREGSNEFIVLVDNSKQIGFNAACYHKDLEPFMARGRALKASGKNSKEVFDIRETEMKSGKITIPTGSTLHIYYGAKTKYNPETSEVEDARLRYVVYMPWATSTSTGLPKTPSAPNHPWIMNPGTHKAHIMISPITTNKR
jgi:hypothetical protein